MPGTPAPVSTTAVTGALIVRAAVERDHAAVNDIYNHYVRTSTVTVETEALALAGRGAWFATFAATGAYRLLIAENKSGIVGFACSRPFRNRPAYATSIETSVYVSPQAQRRGAGSQLYDALFAAVAGEYLHRAYAALALPNDASVALHRKFGFRELAVLSESGRKFGKYWDILWMECALP